MIRENARSAWFPLCDITGGFGQVSDHRSLVSDSRYDLNRRLDGVQGEVHTNQAR